MKPKIFIDGEHGTTGLQIRSRLAARDDIEIISVPAERRKDAAARAEFLNAADVAILCLPDDAARESVALIANDTTRVIDASTAHRVAEGWAYGFAEMDKDQARAIAAAKRVANPGCWPQGPIATLQAADRGRPAARQLPVTMNGISGYSGGGRTMVEDYVGKGEDAPEFLPYGLTFQHKHVPELRKYAGLAHDPLMQPAVGNFAQGMITCVPLQLGELERVPTGAELHAAIADHYAGIENGSVDVAPFAPLERSADIDPEIYNDTNRMRLYVFANDSRAQALLVAVYDNLGKGASGAAVQNMDLMLGLSALVSAMPKPAFPRRWKAEPELIAETFSSRIWKVSLDDGSPAIVKDLKPHGLEDELSGMALLAWRHGEGAIKLLDRDGHRMLLEYAGERHAGR